MEQQTAVEWLESQLDFLDNYMSKKDKIYLFEQAKQMEKEQIMKAVYNSMGTNFDPNMGRAEQYYKDTYNK